jgi:BirA family biotin operon repressor/biotin-[acetyl-CoA-carboxylase] ligase
MRNNFTVLQIPGFAPAQYGREIRLFGRLDSTNAEMHRLFQADAAVEGLTLVAEEQTAGRGRYGREWVSPRRCGLWFSVLVFSPPNRLGQRVIPLLTGVAAARGIRRATGLPAMLKWPNDLMLRMKKTGGILCETVGTNGGVICGVGVNMKSEGHPYLQKSQDATALRNHCASDLDRNSLLKAILEEIEIWMAALRAEGADVILREWRELEITAGERVLVERGDQQIIGFSQGIDEDGTLLVETDDGRLHNIEAGSVHFLEVD